VGEVFKGSTHTPRRRQGFHCLPTHRRAHRGGRNIENIALRPHRPDLQGEPSKSGLGPKCCPQLFDLNACLLSGFPTAPRGCGRRPGPRRRAAAMHRGAAALRRGAVLCRTAAPRRSAGTTGAVGTVGAAGAVGGSTAGCPRHTSSTQQSETNEQTVRPNFSCNCRGPAPPLFLQIYAPVGA
jgi:hypothetical protein